MFSCQLPSIQSSQLGWPDFLDGEKASSDLKATAEPRWLWGWACGRAAAGRFICNLCRDVLDYTSHWITLNLCNRLDKKKSKNRKAHWRLADVSSSGTQGRKRYFFGVLCTKWTCKVSLRWLVQKYIRYCWFTNGQPIYINEMQYLWTVAAANTFLINNWSIGP